MPKVEIFGDYPNTESVQNNQKKLENMLQKSIFKFRNIRKPKKTEQKKGSEEKPEEGSVAKEIWHKKPWVRILLFLIFISFISFSAQKGLVEIEKFYRKQQVELAEKNISAFQNELEEIENVKIPQTYETLYRYEQDAEILRKKIRIETSKKEVYFEFLQKK